MLINETGLSRKGYVTCNVYMWLRSVGKKNTAYKLDPEKEK
jgi:hypothetical protein